MIAENTRIQFYLFLNGEISIENFEQWVYANNELEKQLKPQDYLDLLSFNFKQQDATYELKKLLENHISQLDFDNWNIRKLLNELITEQRDPVVVIDHLYNLYCNGYGSLREVGLPFVLGVDDIPRLAEKALWNEHAFETKRKMLGNYLRDLKPKSMRLLEALDKGEIKIVVAGKYQISSELVKSL